MFVIFRAAKTALEVLVNPVRGFRIPENHVHVTIPLLGACTSCEVLSNLQRNTFCQKRAWPGIEPGASSSHVTKHPKKESYY